MKVILEPHFCDSCNSPTFTGCSRCNKPIHLFCSTYCCVCLKIFCSDCKACTCDDICPACLKQYDDDDMVFCDSCELWVHYRCLIEQKNVDFFIEKENKFKISLLV